MSVDPSGGSAASTATATAPKTISSRGRGSHPVRSAESPVSTAKAPSAIAAQSNDVTTIADGWTPKDRPSDGSAAEGPRRPTTVISGTLAALAVSPEGGEVTHAGLRPGS